MDTDPFLVARGVLTAATDSRGLRHGDLAFVYDGGPGLVTRLEGWAETAVDWSFDPRREFSNDDQEAADARKVAVVRNAEGELDIAVHPVALAAAEGSWHLIQDDGTIVAGGPRREKGSLSESELEQLRDIEGWVASMYGFVPQPPWLAGSQPVHGVPASARRSPTVDHPQAAPPEDNDTFTVARRGLYIWCAPPDSHPERRGRYTS